MKLLFPYVPRGTYNLLEQQMKERIAAAESCAVTWREVARDRARQLDDLMARYHTLRLQGYVETPKPPAVPTPKRDPVVEAINRASQGNRELRAQMLAQADRDRKAGKADEVIVMAIEKGTDGSDLTVDLEHLLS